MKYNVLPERVIPVSKRQVCFFLIMFLAGLLSARETPVLKIEKIPVQEVSIFKDGHSFVLHEASAPLDPDGVVEIEYLPEAVLGTFWAYSAEPGIVVNFIQASQAEKEVTEPVASIAQLLEANVGREAELFLTSPLKCKILSVPREKKKETRIVRPARWVWDSVLGRSVWSPEQKEEVLKEEPPKVVLVKPRGAKGVRAIPFFEIKQIQIEGKDINLKRTRKEKVGKLTLRLGCADGKKRPLPDGAKIGIIYLQKGLRWIPEYAVDIKLDSSEDKGEVKIKLQATLINDLIDLKDVRAHLVVGVPNFAFAHNLSPLAMKEEPAELSRYFGREAGAFSNILMTQSASPRLAAREAPSRGPFTGETGTGATIEGGTEDLFVYQVDSLTLPKGARGITSVIEFTCPYKDAYVADIPFSPPPQVWRNLSNQQRRQIADMSRQRRIRHTLRIKNTSPVPFTTGAAMILKQNRLLAQSLLRYTSIGNETDLPVTDAIDIHLKKSEQQIKVTMNAVTIDGSHFRKLELEGTLELTNFKDKTVSIEVHRYLFGSATEVSAKGKIKILNILEDFSFLPGAASPSNRSYSYPLWWGWYDWPWWCWRLNSASKIDWEITLKSKESKKLSYKWSYYWK